jgi:hypothetical protein
MATLALSLTGQAAGAALGGPVGAALGRSLGALAGNALDHALVDPKAAAVTPDIRLSGSSEGGGIPRLYGWVRVAGNIIWASALEKLAAETRGGKGTSSASGDRIVASFALGLGQGVVQRLGRIWADGDLLDPSEITLRFYRGDDSQMPDSLIEARQGRGNAPAYRGLCYLVFERLPLERFGNRIPNITVELCRLVGDLEPAIRSVTIIPGATEYGYDPVPRVRVLGAGRATGENQHQSAFASDWTLAINDLLSLCPNLTHVALVVAWFGTDLRAASCRIRPAVEARDRVVKGTPWSVAGLTRATAALVSRVGAAPAYGGTPSDSTVRAAIADLRARGLAVTLYPMILMDIPAANPAGQPPYPWRGRITLTPGAEGTAAAAREIDSFMGTATDWGYRRFITHYATLARDTGVEALIIGSEMVGLTPARSAPLSFPFVDALMGLARDIRRLAPALKLTYAADWTEYAGTSPATAPGDRLFPLDALWAAPEIDAVGIDCYMPIADWREGTDHPDWLRADGPYDLGYLTAGVTGGEGFDWYYKSEADRQKALRTPIRDGAFGEDWIWRVKDIAAWWSNRHYTRLGGQRATTPTPWQPGMKPIWFTELGAGAVDKAANAPNVFTDKKSSEDARPPFSSAAPDALAQRQALRAHLALWQGPKFRAMVGRITLWTWDARCYPAFPTRTDVWADGANHATGHWLNGRLGCLASDELARAIARDFSITLSADSAAPLISGLVLEGTATAREALEALGEATGLVLSAGEGGLRLSRTAERDAITISDRVAGADAGLRFHRADPGDIPGRLVLSYADRERDYAAAAITIARPGSGPLVQRASPLVLDASAARRVAESALAARVSGADGLDLTLPPSLLALEPGDLIRLADAPELYEITEIRDGLSRRVSARVRGGLIPTTVDSGRTPSPPQPAVMGGEPHVVIGQLPGLPESPGQSRLFMAGFMVPWPGDITLADADTGTIRARLSQPAATGELAAPLPALGVGLRHAGPLDLQLYGGHIAGVEPLAMLAGANRLALETTRGWEIIGFERADLIGPGRYRLSGLLRGQWSTDAAIGPADTGSRVVIIDDAVVFAPLDSARLGDPLALVAFAGARDPTGTRLDSGTSLAPLLPLAPAHPRARRLGGGDIEISWCRRSRADPEGWALEPPLDTPTETYRLVLRKPTGLVLRTIDVAAPVFVYARSAQIADFGGPAPGFGFSVAQTSPILGPGPASEGTFNA